MTHALLLSGEIGVRFFVRLPKAEDGFNRNSVGVRFEITGKQGKSADIPYSDDLPKNSSGYCGFTYFENSIQMADTITATLYSIEDGEERIIETETYSAKQYFLDFDEKIEQNPNAVNPEMQALIKSVADFGHYVQIWLQEVRGFTVGEGMDHAEMDKFYATYDDADLAEALAYTKDYEIVKDEKCKDIKKITTALNLESETALYIFLTTDASFNGVFNATVDGKKVEVEKESNTRYVIKIKNINAKRLSKTYNVVVKTANGTSTVKVSCLSYIYTALNAIPDNIKARNALIAIYRYARAQKELQ
jgi:hypothetical protein